MGPKERLASAVRKVVHSHQEDLEREKARSAERRQQPELIWELLLLSFATMGNSRGVALVENSLFHNPVRFTALARLSPNDRLATLKSNLRAARVRMPDKKADWLAENFERIQREGGIKAVNQKVVERTLRDDKISYLRRTFQGIGKKYARNMMMDIAHPDFQDSIAIDDRVKKIMEVLGLRFSERGYEDTEQFFLDVAREVGLTGWELDRLLYRHTVEVLEAVEA
jgi:thermostable 8-oxoguanine DNA glycosylase